MAENELRSVKRYMHLDLDDDTDDDLLTETIIPAAKAYLEAAGIVPNSGNAARYTLAFHSLALYYYDNRDAAGGEAPLPVGLRPIINQLKLGALAPSPAE